MPGGPCLHSENWARFLTDAAAVLLLQCMRTHRPWQVSSTANPLGLKACAVAPRTGWQYSDFFIFCPGEAPGEIF